MSLRPRRHLLNELREAASRGRFIVISSHIDEFTVHRALRAQVHGFIDKKAEPLAVLRDAIRTVLDGKK